MVTEPAPATARGTEPRLQAGSPSHAGGGKAAGRSYDPGMAYDEDLANRIRELLGPTRGVTEQRMFGGLAFLIGGNMAVAASGQGGLLVRADPDEGEKLIATKKAQPMEMRGRAMAGWLRVSPDQVKREAQLTKWVKVGTAYASSLPPKRGKK